MKTLTFATTQINFINCVEYLNTINGDNTLFLMADTPARQKQIELLLNNPAYSYVFRKVVKCPMSGIKLIDFSLTICYLLLLRLISKLNNYSFVITGNYKNYGARLAFLLQRKKQSGCELIVCDDGLATSVIAKSRIEELKTNKPFMFCAYKLLLYVHRKDLEFFIPQKITYYTSYNITTVNHDRIIKNEYSYIKTHLSDFNIENDVFNCNAILLGQPLYCKGYVSSECYRNKLFQYYKTVGSRIIYYAHPEENEKLWRELRVGDIYTYVNNFLPFEIIASILPRGCRVASFFSSVLMNLHIMDESLQPECITFSKEQLLNQSNYTALEGCYNCYKSENVKFYKFD